MLLFSILIGALAQNTVTAVPQPVDDMFEDSTLDFSAIGVGSPVSLNIGDSSYQRSDSDRSVDLNFFEIPSGSSDFGQLRSSSDPSDSSTFRIDANGLTGSIGQNVAASQEGNVQLGFDGPDIQQEYQVEQADGKTAMFSEASNPFTPLPHPPLPQILEPSCPAGKKPFCCSGGKAADNIGKGCGEWSLDNWLCFLKYFTLCCKGYVGGSETDAEECDYAPE